MCGSTENWPSIHFRFFLFLSGEVQDSESDSNLHQVTYAIEKGRRGYGMTLKPIRVFIGNTDNFRTHHIIEVCK